jgi:lysophospholipase L1-like esterase
MARWLAVVGSLLVTFAVVAAIESGLRLAGFEVKITRGADPRANLLPLLRPAVGPDGTPVLERPDAPVSLRRDKPAGGLRVFVLGESSVFGYPYGPEFAFPRHLGDRLRAAFPGRTVEVVNCGVPAVGSWHVRRIAEEVIRYEPDVLIVYTGHNDWILPAPTAGPGLPQALTRLRLYQLAVVTRARWRRWRYGPIDEARMQAANDPWGYLRQRVRGEMSLTRAEVAALTARFADNMRAIVHTAQGAGARVVLTTLAQNLRDFSPGASRHRPGLSAATRARWAVLAAEAGRELHDGACAPALERLRRVRRLDPRPAVAHYLRGRCLERLGRFGKARAAYRLASDLDAAPMGTRSSFNVVLRGIAAETGADLVDVAGGLVQESAHGLVGNALFLDHLHPTVAGHVAIARVLAPALGASAAYTWPDPGVLAAGDPEIRKQTATALLVVNMVLGRYDAALAELDAVPELGSARGAIESMRDTDRVPPWTDPPEAPD